MGPTQARSPERSPARLPLRGCDDLLFFPGWVRDHEEVFRRLRSELSWTQRQSRTPVGYRPTPRLECLYTRPAGRRYAYSGQDFVGEDLDSNPILGALLEELSKLNRLDLVGGNPRFNAVFANCYRSGSDSVGWHADDEELYLGPRKSIVIASISFGAPRRFQVRYNGDGQVVWDGHLGEGDLLLMGRGVQEKYTHQCPKEPGRSGERINLTVRALKGPT